MTERDDITLLREFAATESEAAFAALVRRHINLVYSTALRSVGSAHAAEEISQAVFIILAQKAGKLSPRIVLSGWLHQTTRLTAANFLRGEIRRQKREQEAYMQSALNEPEPNVWPQIAPLLDDALGKLGERDRNAIVLRFFENKSLAEVGTALGASEDAAKMRVTRALEKLRKLFSKRGVALSATLIAGAVSASSVQAAPAGLAATISTVALTKGAAAGGSTLTLVKGALKIMAWTKMKTAVVVGVGVLLAAGTTTITIEKIIAPAAPFIRIEGKGRIELYNFSGKPRVVETGNLVILTDGKSYRISIASVGHSGLTNDFYDVNDDYGCDGADTFVLSGKLSYFHRTHDGLGGFAYPGRFPVATPEVIYAAWLAYCSKDYFNITSNQTGLKLFRDFSTVWPDFITNQVTYWPNSTLPQSITGWSRNWIMGVRTNSDQPKQAVELEQYPNGFKAWKFTASDPVMVGNIRVPRQIALETFYPKPPDTATTGDETMPSRKATFTVDSVEIGKGRFNPLPPVTVPDLQIEDWRFKDVAGNFIIGSHATPQGWPVRGSKGFRQAAAEATKLAAGENHALIQSELKKEAQIIPPP
jgi:RNA polymerase sigma factor (sigma-70 family)